MTTLSDHDVCNTLPLVNRFQVFTEIDEDISYASADVASPTPCHTTANSSQIGDSSMLRQGIRDSSCNLLNQPLTSHFASADKDVSVCNTGFNSFEGTCVTEGKGVVTQKVTDHELVHRTQLGASTKHCSDNHLAVPVQTHSQELMNDTHMLESDLQNLELHSSLDPSAQTYFSKSFMANKEVPDIIRQQCHNSKDFQLSKKQNGHDFGFIPLTDVKTYQGPPVTWPPGIDILEAHSIIRNSGVPNFLKCRIPVQTQLNPKVWAQKLENYWDQQLPDLIAFGFPLDFDRSNVLTSSFENHTSATDHVAHIDRYIQEELQHKALYGPFESVPFKVHVSPLMTREKQNSDNRRTIVDLSWPLGQSVNAGVKKNSYLGTYFDLKYPSIDHIVKKLKLLGTGALLYKVDISRAFRRLRIDPGDIDLLGIYHNQLFLDGSLPFGFRLGSGFFEKCSDAIRYMMSQAGHNGLMNYIDDLLYVGTPKNIWPSYYDLLQLLQDLGLEVSQRKLVPPSTQVICLGILVDSVQKTLSIPEDKLKDIINMVNSWQDRRKCTKNQFQSLLGSLLYITKCVHPARYFLNRMLLILRNNTENRYISLDKSFFQDLNWFQQFLKHFNGITYFDNRKVQGEIHLDASLTGFGACYNNMVYALPLPASFSQFHITQLEMLNVIVALKVWANLWQDKKITLYCDNMAVVEVLTTGKTRDPFLATCARNIWLITAIFNIQLQVLHVPGKANVIADLLSRWTVTVKPEDKLRKLMPNFLWINTHINLTALNYGI